MPSALACPLGRPNAFEPTATEMVNPLGATARRPYENALVRLGEFAGAFQSTGDEGRDAAPDAVWEFGDHLWIAWEAKSEAAADSELGAADVRQAGSHLRYHASTTGRTIPTGSISIIVTPQTQPPDLPLFRQVIYLATTSQDAELFYDLGMYRA